MAEDESRTPSNSTSETVQQWASGETTGPQAVRAWLNRHPKKNGWYVVAILVLIGLCFLIYNERGTEVEEVSRERDKYFQALQPWQAFAANIYTNELPSKQLALLLSVVTNALDPSRFTFSLFANERQVTTNLPFICELNRDRTLKLIVRNDGGVAAQNIGLSFSANISTTNLLSEGWHQERGRFETIDGKLKRVKDVETWSIGSTRSVPNGTLYEFALLSFTNLTKPIFGTTVEIHADNARMQKFQMFIVDTNK